MKTVQLSYLHLSNILLNRVEFLSRVIESSFSTRLEFSNSTSQFNSTLFQKNFNSIQHFSSQVLDSNSNTRLDAISLLSIRSQEATQFMNCSQEAIQSTDRSQEAIQSTDHSQEAIQHSVRLQEVI